MAIIGNNNMAHLVGILSCVGVFSCATAQQLTLGSFGEIGNVSNDSVVSNASASGATLTYTGSNNTANDSGILALLNSPEGVLFSNVGDLLTYSFTYSGIVATANSNNMLRAGFRFGGEALHWITGIGTSVDGRFNYQSSNNMFGSGTTVGASATIFNDPSLRFDDGNTVNVTFALELVAIGATNSYDFTVTYASGTASNARTHTFTGINGNLVNAVYHLTNSNLVETNGDTWTVSNASATFAAVPEPSVYAAAIGLAALLAVGVRRRRTVGW
jgi:hypothetical protein